MCCIHARKGRSRRSRHTMLSSEWPEKALRVMPRSQPGQAWERNGPSRGQAPACGTLTKQQESWRYERGGMVKDVRSVCKDQIARWGGGGIAGLYFKMKESPWRYLS